MNLKNFSFLATIITALCCFTPILTTLLAFVGVSWVIGYLDYVLIPALVFFIGLTIFAFLRQRKHDTE